MTHYIQEWPLLILCPASLRHTWPSEIEKFLPTLSPMAIHVVGGFDDTDWVKRRRQLKIVVATYSLLQSRSAVARIMQDFDFECVICDESHNLKERTSQRCQLAMPILLKAKRLILLSGTPALARPVELWAQVNCIAPNLFGAYTKYTKEYCNARRGRFGWDVSGLSNAEELHANLRQIMVRRLKTDVLKELPPKQRSMVPIKIDKGEEKDCRDLMEDLKAIRMSVSDLVGSEAKSADFEARRLLMMAYQRSGIGKAASVAQYLVDWLDGSGTQKVLVFAHHQQVMDVLEKAIAKKFKGVGHIRIDGSVDSKERAMRVKKFQTNARTRVALLSMTAAGVGLTLTAASSVIFAELHWTPGVLAQAEDRCHRIGQQNAVNVMYCVCKDENLSVDMKLWSMLGRKVGNLGRVIDGGRNATLRAEEGKSTTRGESVEAELTRFFAETSGEEKTAALKAPVKGSITSFFKPASAASSSEEKQKLPPSGIQSLLPARPVPSSGKRIDSLVEWNCDACTFANSKVPANSGWLACEVCGTPHIDIPPSEGKKCRPITRKQKEIIALDDLKPKASRIARSCEVITIDDDGEPESRSIVTPSKQSIEQPLITFSVSKNSGRLTIHSGDGEERFPYNFDIEQVISEEMSDRLLEAEVSRQSKSRGVIKMEFNEKGIKQVLAPIVKELKSKGQIKNRAGKKRVRQEVKDFVSIFLNLREVEKKAIKESGKSFAGLNLKQSVARLLTSTVTQSTDRYSGGAKERAREKVEEGTATESDHAVLDGRACAWCAGSLSHVAELEGVASTYCSQKCAEEGRLHRGGMFSSTQVRAQVFGLEGGVCRKCGIDAHALYTRICSLEPAERLNALINAKWSLPKSGPALDRLLQIPREGDYWQADHIVAVAEGGGGCGLDNLQTLCTPCHQGETNKLRARLKLGGKVGDCDGKRKQIDIRSAFFGSAKKVKK
jgi:SWI/SNF-related matrix-associated actin-dependent regulator 1 of chromatin subfamily A